MCNVSQTCPTGTILLTHDLATKPVPATCRKWSCPSCGPRKARRLRKRLAKTTPSRLITLTLAPRSDLTPRDQLALANRAWSILWRRLRRKHGKAAIGYAKIVELTKAGTPHLHIIASCPFTSQRWLSAAWRELTGSYVVDIRKVNQKQGISRYLTSYLTKAMEVPDGMRKWSSSAAYVPPEEPEPLESGEIRPDVSFRPVTVDTVLATYKAAGYWELRGWWHPPELPQPLNPGPT